MSSRPRLVPRLFAAVALAVALAACGDDGGSDDDALDPGAACPVAPSVVADALAATVEVGEDASAERCTYLVVADPPAADEGPGRSGGRVVVDVRPLAEGDFARALERVERRAGPTQVLAAGDVDGASRGWVATVGRAVSVGAANDVELATTVVLDPSLDAVAARDAALEIADETLG